MSQVWAARSSFQALSLNSIIQKFASSSQVSEKQLLKDTLEEWYKKFYLQAQVIHWHWTQVSIFALKKKKKALEINYLESCPGKIHWLLYFLRDTVMKLAEITILKKCQHCPHNTLVGMAHAMEVYIFHLLGFIAFFSISKFKHTPPFPVREPWLSR